MIYFLTVNRVVLDITVSQGRHIPHIPSFTPEQAHLETENLTTIARYRNK